MKNFLTLLFTILLIHTTSAQEKTFDNGEWFKFRIHYGFFTASYATLKINNATLNGKEVYHIKGRGKSTGLLSLFFKVDDDYQTYFDKETGNPYKFIRNINEGGYTKNIEIAFNHTTNTAHVNDKKHNKKSTHKIKPNTQDMLSAFYYLRKNVDINSVKIGDETKINMFFDKENFEFKLRFLGREILDTKFGKVACLKFRPIVQSGRVFKEKEALTIWISDNKNKAPIRLQADLVVGSLRADLEAYSGLQHPFK